LSCGCYGKERRFAATATRLGHWRKPEYKSWTGAIARCYDVNNDSYEDYGGRGIAVCPRWLDEEQGYSNFLEDMGPRPKGTSLDRVDNGESYSPKNCRWATTKEQARNRRSSMMLTFNGETLAAAAWADRTGLSRACITQRINRGWSVEMALTRPANSGWRRSS
jgi:hypothetical protein